LEPSDQVALAAFIFKGFFQFKPASFEGTLLCPWEQSHVGPWKSLLPGSRIPTSSTRPGYPLGKEVPYTDRP
jgi:hypothetical protein